MAAALNTQSAAVQPSACSRRCGWVAACRPAAASRRLRVQRCSAGCSNSSRGPLRAWRLAAEAPGSEGTTAACRFVWCQAERKCLCAAACVPSSWSSPTLHVQLRSVSGRVEAGGRAMAERMPWVFLRYSHPLLHPCLALEVPPLPLLPVCSGGCAASGCGGRHRDTQLEVLQ